jgi:Tat protein secretion system quality control protein TatD with DNase activity
MVARNTTVSSQNHHVTEYFVQLLFADDFAHMLARSKRAGVVSMVITGGSLSESKLALDLAKEHSTSETLFVFREKCSTCA